MEIKLIVVGKLTRNEAQEMAVSLALQGVPAILFENQSQLDHWRQEFAVSQS